MAVRPLPAVLLPGFDGSGRLFDPFLAAGTRALAPAVVSYPPDEPLGYDALERLVRDRLPRRGRFVLVAESFSGPIAVRIAARPPRGLAAVVLAATFLHRPLHPFLHPLRGLVGARFFGMPMPATAVRHLMAGRDAPEAMVREVQAAVAALSVEVAVVRAAEALAVDVRGALAATRLPILVLSPSGDRLLRADTVDEVLALRPDAEVCELRSPHMILQRHPHACLARIEAFVRDALAPGRGARRALARPGRAEDRAGDPGR